LCSYDPNVYFSRYLWMNPKVFLMNSRNLLVFEAWTCRDRTMNRKCDSANDRLFFRPSNVPDCSSFLDVPRRLTFLKVQRSWPFLSFSTHKKVTNGHGNGHARWIKISRFGRDTFTLQKLQKLKKRLTWLAL